MLAHLHTIAFAPGKGRWKGWMIRSLLILLMVAWGLWLGGTCALMIFVIRLFGADRDSALQAAPVLFDVFRSYQLVIGIIAWAAAVGLGYLTRRRTLYLSSLLLFAAVLSAALIYFWTGRLEQLRADGHSDDGAFQTLHKATSIAYAIMSALILLAGVAIAISITPLSGRRQASESAPATDFPA